MTKNTWLALIFFTFTLAITFRKQLAWLYWKYKRLTIKEQAFDLLSKDSFIEINGSAKSGKSWLLAHIFKQLEGVKLTNLPTPNSFYTLNEEILQVHMISKWGVPHKWYYFLDDITTFQEWTKNKLGEQGYTNLQNYVGRAGKLGANFIWTNNGTPIDPVFEQNKNTTWKVEWHFKFLERYSLLAVKTKQRWYNFWPTILAIDNKEISKFYDKFWNIPRENQENFLTHTTEAVGAKELGVIIKKIKETNAELDFNDKTVQLLLQYTKKKRAEVRGSRANKQKKDKLRQELLDFGLDPNKKITHKQIAEWEKEGKFKYFKDKGENQDKKIKPVSQPTKEAESDSIDLDLLDLDQANQDPEDPNNSNDQ